MDAGMNRLNRARHLRIRIVSGAAVALALLAVACASENLRDELAAPPPDNSPAAVKRGEYLFDAANCVSCHTDKKHGGARLAGGRGLETPFGTFYSRNITPDPEHGIGAWSDQDFVRALPDGISPTGAHYFPAFPFPSFTLMTTRDMLDIKAYLFTQAPSAQADRPHDVPFPFNMRLTMVPWRALNFEPGPFVPDPARDAEWNRGAYLVNAVAHCGECHTPRDWLGALEQDRRFAGARLYGGTDLIALNITPDAKDGIGKWSAQDIAFLLKSGFKQNGEAVNPTMGEVVDATTKLTDADRLAIAKYLKTVPPQSGDGR